MRNLRPLVVCIVLLLALIPAHAFAAGPVLTPTQAFPAEGQPGEPQVFHILYTNLSGDPATSVVMVVQTPAGQSRIPGTQPQGTDPGQGIQYTFTFTPQNTGLYRYHFVATSTTGQSAQFPAGTDLQFTSYSLITKYIILAIGLLVALLFLPFIVYVVARSANKRGNPASAARIGLLIGVLASYLLFVYLFFTIYGTLTIALAGIAAVAVLIALFSKR